MAAHVQSRGEITGLAQGLDIAPRGKPYAAFIESGPVAPIARAKNSVDRCSFAASVDCLPHRTDLRRQDARVLAAGVPGNPEQHRLVKSRLAELVQEGAAFLRPGDSGTPFRLGELARFGNGLPQHDLRSIDTPTRPDDARMPNHSRRVRAVNEIIHVSGFEPCAPRRNPRTR